MGPLGTSQRLRYQGTCKRILSARCDLLICQSSSQVVPCRTGDICSRLLAALTHPQTSCFDHAGQWPVLCKRSTQEITARMIAARSRFFCDVWNVVDLHGAQMLLQIADTISGHKILQHVLVLLPKRVFALHLSKVCCCSLGCN